MIDPGVQRMDPEEQRKLEQEWLTRRLEGVNMEDFGDYAIRFYLTADLQMPERFDGLYHVCSHADGKLDLPDEEGEKLSRVDSLLVFCNYTDPAQLGILEDITYELDIRGTQAPPVFLLFHTHRAHCLPNEAQTRDMETCVRELLAVGVDGIMSDEQAGMAFVWEVRMMSQKAHRLARHLGVVLARHRAQALKAQSLQECIDVIMWGYLRVRLAPCIPALDEGAISSNGKPMIPGFELGRMLGEGMTGSVYQLCARGKPSGSVVKMHPKSSIKRIAEIRTLKRTIGIAEMLSNGPHAHPSIVKLYSVIHSPSHILLRMEDAGPQNLYQHLMQKPLGVEKGKSLLMQALQVVNHLHSFCAICHRDLKPENFLVSEGGGGTVILKLVDFDMAVVMKPGMLCTSPCGTMPFVAPEVMLEEEYDGLHADIWSIGLVMIEVLLGVRSLEAKLRLSKVTAGVGEGINHAMIRVIKTFFQPPGAVLNFVAERCRCEFRHFLPVCAPIFTGTLRTKPEDRWDSRMCYNKILEL